jgi:hypothetical protein
LLSFVVLDHCQLSFILQVIVWPWTWRLGESTPNNLVFSILDDIVWEFLMDWTF